MPLPSFPALAFPPLDVPVRTAPAGTADVFDPVRRRWVRATPEEWVRQHLIRFLAEHRGYALALMAVEKAYPYHGLMRRADLVCFGTDARPLLVCECKAPAVALTQETVAQAARYNLVVGAPLWLVTNGLRHVVGTAPRDGRAAALLPDVPPRRDAEGTL